MLNQEIKLKNKTSNTLLNNISNNKISYPKSTLNTNPSRKNQLNKIKSTSHNTKYKNDLKKPLMITTTNSIEKMMLRHRKMKLKNEKNNKNKNYINSLKNSILNEESQKEEISKGNQSNRNSKKNSVVLKNNNNNLNNLILNNNILNNDNYDNNYINENNQIEYGKIFGLLNNEIKEITDLFKRTQSVDQQKNNYQEINFFNLQGLEEISTNLFEKQNENENEKFEKMIDISQLENEEEEISVNRNKSQSILFSSYNSEFYKNLNNIHKNNNNDEGDDNYNNDYTNLSASSFRNNIMQIAKNNIILQEEEKNLNQNNGNDNSVINDDDKTKCQFVDVDFNNNFEENDIGTCNECNYNYNNENILDGIDSENTNTIMDEINNINNVSKNIPIQEIIQKIRDN